MVDQVLAPTLNQGGYEIKEKNYCMTVRPRPM